MIEINKKSHMNGGKSRNWCFTWNNPTHYTFDWPSNVKYCVYQLEAGANNTRHLQGYLELSTPRGLAYLVRLIPGAHWEIRCGTAIQARNYCMKEDTRIEGPWEHGNFNAPNPGKRNDLLEIKALLDAGTALASVYDQHFQSSARYYKFFDRYLSEKRSHRSQPPEVYLFCGRTGAGKSRNALEANDGLACYWKSRGEWWDGYTGQPVCIIDEFYGWLSYDFILRLTDRYPLDIPVKGGFTKFTATTLFFTSNRPPWDWWSRPKDQAAFSRRITSITHFESSEIKYTFSSLEEYKSFYYLMNFK